MRKHKIYWWIPAVVLLIIAVAIFADVESSCYTDVNTCYEPAVVYVGIMGVKPVCGHCETQGNCYIESPAINGIYVLRADANRPFYGWSYKSEDIISTKAVPGYCYYGFGLEIRVYLDENSREYMLLVTSDISYRVPYYASYFYGSICYGWSSNEQIVPLCGSLDNCIYCSGTRWTSGIDGYAWVAGSSCGGWPFNPTFDFITYAALCEWFTQDGYIDIDKLAYFCQMWLYE